MYTVPSRVNELDIDICREKSEGNHFNLILAAARRTRELRKRNDDPYARITALDGILDIQNDVISCDQYLKAKK